MERRSGVNYPHPTEKLKISSQKLNWIAEKYGLELIVLFGSWSAGNANPNSDVDIAIKINEKFRSLDEESQIKLEIKLMGELSKVIDSGMGMDLIVLNNCSSSLLLFQIASFGKPLYERTRSAFAKFQSVACLRYYDDEKFFRAIDEYLKSRYAKYAKSKQNSTNSKKTVKHG